MTGDSLRDLVLVVSALGTILLGVGTIRQNRRAADRTAEVSRLATVAAATTAADATQVTRERLGLDVLEASLERVVADLDTERRLRQSDARWIAQLVGVLRDNGIVVPERQLDTV